MFERKRGESEIVKVFGMAKLVPDQFPAGLRVLLVDDDVVCLKILAQMLQKCAYKGLSLNFVLFI